MGNNIGRKAQQFVDELPNAVNNITKGAGDYFSKQANQFKNKYFGGREEQKQGDNSNRQDLCCNRGHLS